MPSKEQKKISKRAENEQNRQIDNQKITEENSWEEGTNTRSMLKKQQKDEKQAEQLRIKTERQEQLEEENKTN
tara:strand:+ start:2966 stop:3184 length:219 start_codon:yes stop_codon:yes gene_type:complete